ncbi:cobyric acid synthase [Rhodoferax antarcticus]|uniref:Cobyric acid synthase n=1 Tax=Rhodoferax antarcticus ANT.BR TaxID=1111071 RepID=A0A1Q8YDZ0_9BURK|nr:cobyric acid synthase [Rhodoferax antarcticus]APW46107.1 cobyric acid synthase CobQ [Rhodoferax antarcticus]MCW2310325.1 adenosylcobyric acid synthase [Rhodoferax antarcticus]OLP06274.1 cobyric acid synthase CobQ [Rhodoferax antarcticus ANT.BR]
MKETVIFTPAPDAPRRARRLMIQGTSSDVGKSLLVAGLCRAFANRGWVVRPFKAQNMSNNAAVAVDADLSSAVSLYAPGSGGNDAMKVGDERPDCGEIGRAQALQARACGAERSVHMNPVLLKPESDIDCQVVLRGRVLGRQSASAYQTLKPALMPAVLDSLERLSQQADLVLIEGAGSGAEAYLRAQDISNMGLAEAADLPVMLVGDESRGGVSAAVLGHRLLWSVSERARVAGVVVNKFRGDPAVFAPAGDAIQTATGWPVLGLVRWFDGATRLPQEDSLALDVAARATSPTLAGAAKPLTIAVLRTPRMANTDDLDPLEAEPGVVLHWVQAGEPIPRAADVAVLAGSKATRADLEFVRAQGWHHDLHAHVRQGGRVVGLCAGLQMLGRMVRDPLGIEGAPGESEGLGLLDLDTEIGGDKRLLDLDAVDSISGCRVTGYEMHMGRTQGAALARPWLRLAQATGERAEGAVSADGRVMGSYVHGLFASDDFRHHWLKQMRGDIVLGAAGDGAPVNAYEARVEAALNAFAAQLEVDLDLDAIWALAR